MTSVKASSCKKVIKVLCHYRLECGMNHKFKFYLPSGKVGTRIMQEQPVQRLMQEQPVQAAPTKGSSQLPEPA